MSTLQNFLGAALKPVILYMSRGRLPQIDGRLRLPGLNEEVTIQRDKWGIPHISAATRPGLFFAQGFTHAQERLWQMDLNRRAANGQFAALVGPIALDTGAQLVTLAGQPVEVTAYEYKLLEYLMLHAGMVISKTTLTEHLYQEDEDRDSNVLEVLVGRLRRKLDPDRTLNPIETLRGRGYRFALERSSG